MITVFEKYPIRVADLIRLTIAGWHGRVIAPLSNMFPYRPSGLISDFCDSLAEVEELAQTDESRVGVSSWEVSGCRFSIRWKLVTGNDYLAHEALRYVQHRHLRLSDLGTKIWEAYGLTADEGFTVFPNCPQLAIALITSDGKVLLQRRQAPGSQGQIYQVGVVGGIDLAKDSRPSLDYSVLSEAAKRLAREATGIEIDSFTLGYAGRDETRLGQPVLAAVSTLNVSADRLLRSIEQSHGDLPLGTYRVMDLTQARISTLLENQANMPVASQLALLAAYELQTKLANLP